MSTTNTAYYAFANGDPETFAVQFAVLSRAHATSLKLLPARLEKALSAETRKLGDLIIAHQNSVQRMAALLDEEARRGGVGEGADRFTTVQHAIEKQIAANAEVFRCERENVIAALAASGRLLQRLAGQRFFLTVILSYVAGLLTVLIFDELISFIGPMLH